MWVAKLAVDYRQAFNKDVVIDLVCFRRRGHNEGDDPPSMTQPAMYEVIDTKRGVRKSYTEALIGRGDISTKEAEDALRDYQGQLERVFNEVKELEKYHAEPSPSIQSDQTLPTKLVTAVDKEVLQTIGDAFVNVPEGFNPHPRVKPVLERRAEAARNGNIDWAFAELLAFGSLVMEGRTVRLSGQDSRRGTFTQRHSVLIDRQNGSEYTPLNHLQPADEENNGGRFMVYDSPLSEFGGVVGFEYGYSVGNPDALVLWEAQFGDFVNGAQSIIDEFISSGEAKWGGQLSDVVLLLPHGHEGQGPDHTSGRIERFLQLCAEGSMTVALPSTPPASYFHLLRRHVLDGISRPLIVFTPPKSMLRNKAAVSPVSDFTDDKFRSVIDDPKFAKGDADRNKVKRVLLVSGKLYYELAARRDKEDRDDIAIVRIEQLYPVPHRACATHWSSTATPASSAGSRRSRPTRVRGRSSACGCPRSSRTSSVACAACRVARCRPPRPRVRARCTRSSSRRSSTRRSASRSTTDEILDNAARPCRNHPAGAALRSDSPDMVRDVPGIEFAVEQVAQRPVVREVGLVAAEDGEGDLLRLRSSHDWTPSPNLSSVVGSTPCAIPRSAMRRTGRPPISIASAGTSPRLETIASGVRPAAPAPATFNSREVGRNQISGFRWMCGARLPSDSRTKAALQAPRMPPRSPPATGSSARYTETPPAIALRRSSSPSRWSTGTPPTLIGTPRGAKPLDLSSPLTAAMNIVFDVPPCSAATPLPHVRRDGRGRISEPGVG